MIKPAEILEGPWDKPDRTMIHENLTLGEMYCITTNPVDIAQANELEARVWRENEYGSTEPNRKFDAQSTLIVAKDVFSGDVIGGVRLFHPDEEGHVLPCIAEMDMSKSLEGVLRVYAHRGKLEELGVLFRDEERSTPTLTAMNLNRLAYRDATRRGIEYWGIIMEPDRVSRMNSFRRYAFKQIGGTTDYQGGECAAHIMKLNTVRRLMRISRKDQYKWFTSEPLSSELS